MKRDTGVYDAIDQLRQAQKTIRRVSADLVFAGTIRPGSAEALFFVYINRFIYLIVDKLVALYYANQEVLPGTENSPDWGEFWGGLFLLSDENRDK